MNTTRSTVLFRKNNNSLFSGQLYSFSKPQIISTGSLYNNNNNLQSNFQSSLTSSSSSSSFIKRDFSNGNLNINNQNDSNKSSTSEKNKDVDVQRRRGGGGGGGGGGSGGIERRPRRNDLFSGDNWTDPVNALRSLGSLFREPFGFRDPLWRDIERTLSSMDPFLSTDSRQQQQLQQWQPKVNVKDTDTTLEIDAELPGMKKEDIKVDIKDDVLTLRGERKMEKTEETDKYTRMEHSYGSFMRRFSLPEGTDPSQVKASYENGMLKLTVPKPESAKSSAHEIKIE